MKRTLLCLVLALMTLTSCRTGDLLTLYSERTYGTSSETAPVTTLPVLDTGTIVLVSMTDTVKQGGMAAVTVKGTPNREYSIRVHYSTGVSSASGLESKFSDSDGIVSWGWRVGSRTKEGSYKVEIVGENELLTLYFTVVSA